MSNYSWVTFHLKKKMMEKITIFGVIENRTANLFWACPEKEKVWALKLRLRWTHY
jgi:hypothetical protein